MANIIKKNFSAPDETSNPGEKQQLKVVTVGDLKIQQVTVEPGWQWSKHIKPVVGGESCQKKHLVYVLSGKLGTKTDDGMEEEFGPGDMGLIPPGHDGWNAGDEPAVWLEILN